MEKTNQLKFENSPYLLQHKDNPIAWQPWGAEAFTTARAEKKPIFLSVGYSTCHWCHVMAHESFEDAEVAQVLNAHFICIKVDREEHPDVDDVYMSALQTLSGGGGWPMSIWLTSEGKPFFAGTYFPKHRFLLLLRRVQEIWTSERDKLLADSERLTAAIRQIAQNEAVETSEADYEEFLDTYINHFTAHFDPVHGGFGGAPKFPQTMSLMMLMRREPEVGQSAALVKTTLLKMVRGGVYDQLNGGFHRYSVDEKWLVPHFEKMLYDQALITVTLVEAFQRSGEPELGRAAHETVAYVLNEMTHAQGGFFSAQDADSINPQTGHSEEGYFCTYDYAELQKTLTPEELARLQAVYGVSPEGCFEGRNILHLQDGYDGRDQNEPVLSQALGKLKRLRSLRPAPHLDDKVIVAWNAWMVWALTKAGMVLAQPRYIQAAQKAMLFMHDHLWKNGVLHRFWREGQAKGAGSAEDYASLIHACLELYQADFDPRWARWALALQQVLDTRFWDGEEGNYFANDGQNALLPLRPRDDYDGVTPCSNSLAALNLARFYLLTGELKFRQQAERIFASLFGKLRQSPSGLPFLALAMDFQLADARAVVISGGGWVADYYLAEQRQFEPHRLWVKAGPGWPISKDKEGQAPALFVCENGRCLAPITSREKVPHGDENRH